MSHIKSFDSFTSATKNIPRQKAWDVFGLPRIKFDMSGLNQIRHVRQNILHHLRRDIHPRGRDAIAKLHRVIDLVDGQAIVRFKQIERQQSAAHRPRGGSLLLWAIRT